jgi:nucleotidyltransferase/DNA polymerase involved in DNA repair
VIPPDANAAFVAAMEDVIEVYHRPHDPDRPVVCVDETSKQLIVETRTPIPAKRGQPRRVNYEYRRNGAAAGWTWLNASSACCRFNASTGASPTRRV